MLQHLIIVFLGLFVQSTCSPAEATGLAKRCDKKSVITIRTECQTCSLNFAVKCPDGYTKITNGSVGVRDCRYTFEIRTHSLSLPGCRHICRKDYLQPQCCPGHWGPDCM
ncbi:stabilin-2-like, partial [Nannospalax galili]|uniref:stabilin-2-like n=1 Tax=Nannospalax galili TaxID=1026970 RepID=UPI00111C82A1